MQSRIQQSRTVTLVALGVTTTAQPLSVPQFQTVDMATVTTSAPDLYQVTGSLAPTPGITGWHHWFVVEDATIDTSSGVTVANDADSAVTISEPTNPPGYVLGSNELTFDGTQYLQFSEPLVASEGEAVTFIVLFQSTPL